MGELRKGYWVLLNGVVERPQYRPGVFGSRMDVCTVQYGALGVAVRGWHLAGFDTYRFCCIPSALPRVECLTYPPFIFYFFDGG